MTDKVRKYHLFYSTKQEIQYNNTNTRMSLGKYNRYNRYGNHLDDLPRTWATVIYKHENNENVHATEVIPFFDGDDKSTQGYTKRRVENSNWKDMKYLGIGVEWVSCGR